MLPETNLPLTDHLPGPGLLTASVAREHNQAQGANRRGDAGSGSLLSRAWRALRKADPVVASLAVFVACCAASVAIGIFLVPGDPTASLTQAQSLWLLTEWLLMFVAIAAVIGGRRSAA